MIRRNFYDPHISMCSSRDDEGPHYGESPTKSDNGNLLYLPNQPNSRDDSPSQLTSADQSIIRQSDREGEVLRHT